MIEVLGIDLSTYKPVEALSYYGQVSTLDAGKVSPITPLPDDIITFLGKFGADVSLWDGSKGVLGREYISNKTLEKTTSPGEIDRLRAEYRLVKQSLSSQEIADKLGKKLKMQTKMQKQLKMTVFEMEQKVQRLQKQQGEQEVKDGEQCKGYKALSARIEALHDEIGPCKAAASRIDEKVQQTRVEIAESECGTIRRIALLRRILAYERDQMQKRSGPSDPKGVFARVSAAEEKTSVAALRLQQAKRFYVDAKDGMAHIYAVETILKEILEHLRECMNYLHGKADNAVKLPLETGFDFRVGYVRKLWNRADASFKNALRYVKETSLPQARATLSQEAPKEKLTFSKQISGSGSGSWSGSGSSGKRFGIFESVATILPSFTRIELSHPISRRSRVSTLHRKAASSYKDVNELYDVHERMMKEALALLQSIEGEHEKANNELIQQFEEMI